MNKAPVVVSQGDAAAIGWPLLLEYLAGDSLTPEQKTRIIVVGDFFESQAKQIKKAFRVIDAPAAAELETALKSRSRKPVLAVTAANAEVQPGRPSSPLALRSYRNFLKAIEYWQQLPAASLVTLPVSKEMIRKAGVDFTGHTGVLAAGSELPVFMCLYHSKLSVIPLTEHVPLTKVSNSLKAVDFNALDEAVSFFSEFFRPKKKLAYLGLNPHAGENGSIGNEEEWLSRTVSAMPLNARHLEGPYAADGFFMPGVRKNFSLAIACYHDQALAPFKALFGLDGLNITLNLKKLRVSPDHGTAYDLAAAGEGRSVRSIEKALKFALKKGEAWSRVYRYR